MKIFIDNGHGRNTAGKRSPDGQFLEYYYNRKHPVKHVFPACPSLYIFAAFKINVIMLSKEEISEVISYCQEHGCSYKDRLTELGIAEWKFYDSKYRYAIQERKIKESGQFLQLKPSSDGSFVPFPSLDSPKTGRKEDKQKCAQHGSN